MEINLENEMNEHKNSVKSGAIPYSDGSGFTHNIEVRGDYIWLNNGEVLILRENWPELRSAIDTAVKAFESL